MKACWPWNRAMRTEIASVTSRQAEYPHLRLSLTNHMSTAAPRNAAIRNVTM